MPRFLLAIVGRTLVALSAFGCLAGGAVRAQGAPEVQVTASIVPDFEFDWGRNGVFCPSCNFGAGNARLAFTDASGQTWVGGIDFFTGAMYPPDGRGVLIDTNSALSTDFGNGPEWLLSNAGSRLVFTRYRPNRPPSPDTAELAMGTMVNGTWSVASIPDTRGRAAPAGSLDPNDTEPRINYVSSSNNSRQFWRGVGDLDVENNVPSSRTDGSARRWIPGTRKIIYLRQPPDSPSLLIDQVFTYDTETGESEQLTFDNVGKTGIGAWRAPEYGNEWLFLVMTEQRTSIRIYRQMPGADGVLRWTVLKTITGPQSAPFFWSPEVFTHNGRSWVFFQVSAFKSFADRRNPNHIGISGIDPLKVDFRMLTGASSPPRLRLDPEYFITAQGPFIYYNRAVPETDTRPAANEGVWRIDTLLGPRR